MIRILILDDDELFGRLLQQNLVHQRDPAMYAVAVASAAAALEQAQSAAEPFDVFLIDQRLGPGPDGIEVFQQLRQINPDAEAILFTGAEDLAAGLRAYEAGVHRYLPKPIEPRELVWILQSLWNSRTTRSERDWLKILNDVAEELQQTPAIADVAAIAVAGGRRLGFERARLWLVSDDGATLHGVSQAGSAELGDFTAISFVIKASPYLQEVANSRDAVFFQDQPHGPSGLTERFGEQGFESPRGEWVGLPLWANERFRGVLMLDNAANPRPLRSDQRHLLRLYGRQVAAALERARLYEQETRRSKELAILNQIGRRVATSAAVGDMETLLREVRNQVGELIDVRNFLVALLDSHDRQFDLRLHVERDRPQRRRRLPLSIGLLGSLATRTEPLFLPTSVRDYCLRHGIVVDGKPARSWMGVPLRIEEHVIGAIVVKNYEREQAFSSEDLRLLVAVADQIAGPIQTARLKEQEAENSRRLASVHRAVEEIMRLAEESEEWFWHATLTAITADYGLRFNRAMLLLTENGGEYLQGRLGIGLLNLAQARRAWRHDRKTGLNFDRYLQKLRSGRLVTTPVARRVRGFRVDLTLPDQVFTTVWQSGKRRVVAVDEVVQQLPADWVTAFGVATCAVLPLRAGSRRIGLLVVDNVHTGEPLQDDLLDQIEALLRQVVLVRENLRQRKARDQLIYLNYLVMAGIDDQPLQRILLQICHAAQSVTSADCVLIYPVKPVDAMAEISASGVQEFMFDSANLAGIGLQEARPPREKPRQHGVTASILKTGRLIVPDVSVFNDLPGRQQLAEHAFIQRERIKSFIGVVVRDIATGDIAGVLYLNYRAPRSFDLADRQQAEAFAYLAGVAIRQNRAGQHVRSQLLAAETQRALRERELNILQSVLENSLRADTDEKNVVNLLLRAARDLIDRPDTTAGLFLRTWEEPQSPKEEPREVRRQYYLGASPESSQAGPRTETDIYRGITGRALLTRQTQMAADINEEQWAEIFYSGQIPDTRSELAVPILLDEHTIGVLNLESPQVNIFSPAHRLMIERLAAVAALALDNVRRQFHLLGVLDAAQAVVTQRTLEDTLSAVLNVARRLAPEVSALTIWYHDQEGRRIIPGPYFGVRKTALIEPDAITADGVVQQVMRNAAPVWAPDVSAEPRLRGSFTTSEGIVSTAAFPLRAGGEVVGALFFNYRQRHVFSNEEQVLFPLIAAITAASIRDAARLEALTRERAQLAAAIAIIDVVGSTTDLATTLTKIMRELRERFAPAIPHLFVYDELERSLANPAESFAFERGEGAEYRGPSRLLLDGPQLSSVCRIARMSLQLSRPVIDRVSDNNDQPGFAPLFATARSELAVTLMSGERLLGVLLLSSAQPDAFSDNDSALFRGVGQQVSIALDRAYQASRLNFAMTAAATTSWAAEIAHDINREVSLIRNRTYWLLEELELTDHARQHVAEIDDSATRLSGTLREPGFRQYQQPQTFNLVQLLQDWINDLIVRRGCRDKVTVDYAFDCTELTLYTHPVALQRVLRHLVHNAIEAMERQGRIWVRTRALADWVLLEIEDSGPGVAAEIRPLIFQQPIIRHKNPDGRDMARSMADGGGLGLIVTRLIVSEMGGDIRLLPTASERGAVFQIRLPLRKE